MLQKVYIHNFRCFENFSIDFGTNLSALIIGKNAVGKSTFREALGVLQAIARGSNRTRNLLSRSDFSHGRVEVPIRFEIECRLKDRKYQYCIAFEWPDRFQESRVLEECLKVDGQVIYTRNAAQVVLADGTKFLLDWHICGLPVITERPGSDNIEELKRFLASMLLLHPIPQLMQSYSEEEASDLQPDASNFVSYLLWVITSYPKAYAELVNYIQGIFPDFDAIQSVARGDTGKQFQVLYKNPSSETPLKVEFAKLSDGEKIFFLSGLIVSLSKMNQVVFCLWDEPDNHLSLSEIGQFFVELRRMKNFKGQFVAVSHHPKAIYRFSDENTYVFARNSHFEPTTVNLLSTLNYRGDLIDALEKDEVPV